MFLIRHDMVSPVDIVIAQSMISIHFLSIFSFIHSLLLSKGFSLELDFKQTLKMNLRSKTNLQISAPPQIPRHLMLSLNIYNIEMPVSFGYNIYFSQTNERTNKQTFPRLSFLLFPVQFQELRILQLFRFLECLLAVCGRFSRGNNCFHCSSVMSIPGFPRN